MSRCLLNHLKLCGNRYSAANLLSTRLSNLRKYSNGEKDNQDLGQTTILVQQGCDIQELPVIVRKIGQDEFIAFCADKLPPFSAASAPKGSEGFGNSNSNDDEGGNGRKKPDVQSSINNSIVLKNIDNCLTTNGIFLLMDTLLDEELSVTIAMEALSKIFRIETLVTLRNVQQTAAYKRLLYAVVKDGTNEDLLGFLGELKGYLELDSTVDSVCNELLRRNSDAQLSVEETCETIRRFIDVKRNASAEKFWTSLVDQEKAITKENIRDVYAILPHVKLSRRTLVSILERKITNLWWNLSPDAVMDILSALNACSIAPVRTVMSLSRWLNTNIHAVNETTLEAIVESFTRLNHTDSQIERALERYIKAKGVKIRSQSLVVTLLTHCAHFRLRNAHILNGCSEFFISNVDKIEPGYFRKLFAPFGYLDYQPLNIIKFWQTIESFVDRNFSKIHPLDLIGTMLACVYLGKFPLNFIKRIFNPYFLDALHTAAPPELHPKIRADLKLFDTALTLECNTYEGPLLPKDHSAKSLLTDGRVQRILNQIDEELALVAGGYNGFSKSVMLASLPFNSLYLVDALLHPPGMGWNFNVRQERNIYTAIVVHLPEHFNSTGEFLIGPQAMRIRHYRRIGLRVVTLQFNTLAKLKIYPDRLNKYLVERIKAALPALPA